MITDTTPGPTHRVAVVAFPGISPFHLSVPALVLTNRALEQFGGTYLVRTCAQRPGVLPTSTGDEVVVRRGLEELARADTVVLPSWDREVPAPEELLAAVRAAHARGARVVGLCLGAFPVAASGIVDGREVATHWDAAAALAERHPAVRVRSDVLWSDLGDVVTSAGVAAALDCCLHVVRTDRGAAAATAVARSLVLAPHRDGTQAQFIPTPVVRPGDDAIGTAMTWALAHLEASLHLDAWAARASMSRRTFTRRFQARTGTSPGAWLLEQRLLRATELLERTDHTVESVARQVGYGSAASLREHFARRFGTSPSQHRRTFAPR
ncbi:GlxA family transcriptional regulator [Cellulomonas soli]|uniref:AraC family transcriptional regulator n=1 Tax=Cellulomonas soli TaxID=931535 RepID=A0A512PFM3_9CELL|nr:helix-turn-helix domain-containing protein [Cellulomonas soli]NYI59860.1 transcriptional regulator GlxA family with amidase domain [Cellulomonas soli]GEP69997.1 AraC family transcriptional regulator [Cellulomonas soli]